MLQSCIWIDPWREEIYQFIPRPEDTDPANLAGYFKSLRFGVGASGNSYDLRSPYAFSIRLYVQDLEEEDLRIESVTVNSFHIELDGRRLDNPIFRNVHSRKEVDYGSATIDLDPAPCCVFWIASERVELDHEEGQILKVSADICFTIAQKTDCQVLEPRFRAVVRKGLFGFTEV